MYTAMLAWAAAGGMYMKDIDYMYTPTYIMTRLPISEVIRNAVITKPRGHGLYASQPESVTSDQYKNRPHRPLTVFN